MERDLKSLSDTSTNVEELERRLELSIVVPLVPDQLECGTFSPNCPNLATCGTFG